MLAGDHVDKKAFGVLELRSLCSDPVELPFDHPRSAGFTAVQNVPDFGQAHADTLAGPQDPQAVQVFLAVFTVPGRCAVRYDGTDVIPMP